MSTKAEAYRAQPALHPQAAAWLATLDAGPDPWVAPSSAEVQRLRAQALAEAEPCPPVQSAPKGTHPVGLATAVEFDFFEVDAGGVPALLFVPEQSRRALLYAHGGGFVFGGLRAHAAQGYRLAQLTQCAVLLPGYRKAPEYPYPAASDDVVAAAQWLAGQGFDDLAVVGDSAGANLAVSAALQLPGLFRALVAVYPFLDPECASDSHRYRGFGFERAEARWFFEAYQADATDPHCAPLVSDSLGQLPPVLVQIAECDILADDGQRLAELIRAGGGQAVSIAYAGMVHGFWRHPDFFDDCSVAYADLVDFLEQT